MPTDDVAVLLSLSMTGSVTQLVKVTVGRPRPGKSRAYVLLASETFTRFDRALSACIGL